MGKMVSRTSNGVVTVFTTDEILDGLIEREVGVVPYVRAMAAGTVHLWTAEDGDKIKTAFSQAFARRSK